MVSIHCQRKAVQASTYRMRVLEVVTGSDVFLTGQMVAQLTGLSYRQTIDALNALNNNGRICRVGRKFTARWGRIPDQPLTHPIDDLDRAFQGFFHASTNNS
jgi:hypothetical protein